jgi:hypothetical protein
MVRGVGTISGGTVKLSGENTKCWEFDASHGWSALVGCIVDGSDFRCGDPTNEDRIFPQMFAPALRSPAYQMEIWAAEGYSSHPKLIHFIGFEEDTMPVRRSAVVERETERIDSFSSLGSNWDSYGGVQIAATASYRAKDIITYLDHVMSFIAEDAPSLFSVPLSDGGVQIELERGDSYIEVEVPSASEKPIGFYYEKNGNTESGAKVKLFEIVEIIQSIF